MPINAEIALGVRPPQIESPMNVLAQSMQLQGAQSANALNMLKLQELKRGVDDDAAMRTALSAPDADPYKVLLGRNKVKDATEFAKGQSEIARQKSQTKQADATTAKTELETTLKKFEHAGSVLSQVKDSASYASARGMLNSQLGMNLPEQYDPALVQQTIAQGQTVTQKLQAEHQRLTLDATLRGQDITARGQDMTDNRVRTEGALNRGQAKALHDDTVKNENLRAGVGPGGALDENAERTAQAIASGQLPPPTGMALLNPKNQRVLGRVMEINPQYDATTVAAKRTAATAFTTGKEGAMMRSLQVAGQHLEQLDGLIDAMNNGNTQLVNKISNVYSQQTGSPAITNFDAAKEVVAKEVMKAIIAGGGGVGEREELARSLANAKSPAQLKGVTQQYRNLMAAQHDALLQQRDAAGLPRSTLPNYKEGHASPQAEELLRQADAILRGGK